MSLNGAAAGKLCTVGIVARCSIETLSSPGGAISGWCPSRVWGVRGYDPGNFFVIFCLQKCIFWCFLSSFVEFGGRGKDTRPSWGRDHPVSPRPLRDWRPCRSLLLQGSAFVQIELANVACSQFTGHRRMASWESGFLVRFSLQLPAFSYTASMLYLASVRNVSGGIALGQMSLGCPSCPIHPVFTGTA